MRVDLALWQGLLERDGLSAIDSGLLINEVLKKTGAVFRCVCKTNREQGSVRERKIFSNLHWKEDVAVAF